MSDEMKVTDRDHWPLSQFVCSDYCIQLNLRQFDEDIQSFVKGP